MLPVANGAAFSGGPGMVAEYCRVLGGTRPINSVLIANNGIAAVKFINSIRSWAFETFGQERAIQMVAMATPEDMRANAEHIRMADTFVEVPGGTNNNNYANVQLIVEVAERTKVDAVWPGWGHASENPDLPQSLSAKGIAFLGPSAHSMAALGDKIGSTLIAQTARVPTIPWSGSNILLPDDQCRTEIEEELYHQACVRTTEECLDCCNRVGYPAMIKASWGGGGKGIRKVHNEEEVVTLFKQVQGEVPGSPVFVMKVAALSRHLEVQLACDAYGNVVALHSRDCSIQRRHQKIIEEGPITVAPPDVVHELEQGARRLAKIVGYCGVATVEYLYSMAGNSFYFLEVNPRLQVEHPVTEWIAGVNLPATQLSIAMGIPLFRLPEIRRFYAQGGGGSSDWRSCADLDSFNFDDVTTTKPKGHVVAVRVTSEDPENGFKPTSGRVQELSFRSKPDVWAYFSIKAGGQIHEFSDSQFGHLFAFGQDRPAAIANMVLALKSVQIRGEIHTNVDYTADLLQDKEYKSNVIHTGWLDSRIAMRIKTQRPPWHICVIAGGLFMASRTAAARVSEYMGYLEKGQIPPVSISLVHFNLVLNIDNVKYMLALSRQGPGSYKIRMNQQEVLAEVHTLRDGGLLCQLDGNSYIVYAEEEAAGTRLLIGGRPCLLQNEHDPSKLVAETPCKLMRQLVEEGSHLNMDEPYAEVEVMKMCMPLLAPASGCIHWRISEGQTMTAGDLIATLDLDDLTARNVVQQFTGDFPELGTPTVQPDKAHHRFAEALKKAGLILAGYEHNSTEVVEELIHGIKDESVPALQWQEMASVLATRLPKELKAELDALLKASESTQGTSSPRLLSFPAPECLSVLRSFLDRLPAKDRMGQQQLVAPLLRVAELHAGGREQFGLTVIQDLLSQYLSVEKNFCETPQADVIEGLRQTHKKDLAKVVDVVLSHQGVARKNDLVVAILDRMVAPNPSKHKAMLKELSSLSNIKHSKVLVKAKLLLEQVQLTELQAGVVHNLSNLDISEGAFSANSSKPEFSSTASGAAGGSGGAGGGGAGGDAGDVLTPRSLDPKAVKESLDARMERLVDAPVAIDDALTSLFDYMDSDVQSRAVETYIRRLYQPYIVKDSVTVVAGSNKSVVASWEFWEEGPPPSIEQLEEGPDSPTFKSPSTGGVKRWGVMVVASTLQEVKDLLRPVISQPDGWLLSAVDGKQTRVAAARKGCAEDLPFGGMKRIRTFLGIPFGAGNVAHVALLPKLDSLADSPSTFRMEDRIHTLRRSLLDADAASTLHGAGVTAVSCIVVQHGQGRAPLRHCFHWSEERETFEEWPLMRHVEPPLSDLLELQKLMSFGEMQYKRSRNRHWHIYSTTEKPSGIRRLFLRSVVRLPKSATGGGGDTSPPGGSSGGSSWIGGGGAGEDGVGSGTEVTREPSFSDSLVSECTVQIEVAARTLAAAIQEALDEPELETTLKADHAHIFMALLGSLSFEMSPRASGFNLAEVERMLCGLGRLADAKVAPRMRSLALCMWEARVKVKGVGVGSGAWRLVAENPSGHACLVQAYMEADDAAGKNFVYFSSPPKLPRTDMPLWPDNALILPPAALPVRVTSSLLPMPSPSGPPGGGGTTMTLKGMGPLHGTPLSAPYGPLSSIDKRRLAARKAGTTFCYDFLSIFEEALKQIWATAEAKGTHTAPPAPHLTYKELIFADPNIAWDAKLQETGRPAGLNSIAMVGWRLTLRTPEFPQGRTVYIVANDVTRGAGAFGLHEDMLFNAITLKAINDKVPLLYLAANSGARIGIAEEVKRCLHAAWLDEKNPERGFHYLYLTPEDYARVRSSVVAHEVVMEPSGERRWVLTDIIGAEEGLGVENLSGSGAIASVFSRAFHETFTLTFVTGRTVGIGAYLARLGSRVIQRQDQPIILTGFSALNKLLGRDVYSSHMQLGGPKVMAVNGVVHNTVANDLDGVLAILRWLSYVPAAVNRPLPIVLKPLDPPSRKVEYNPTTSCDPRAAVAGTQSGTHFLRGIFDEGSFMEMLDGWAKTVVVGRARLGGIPVGVIAVETQTVFQNIPADPGQPDSHERVLPQAGQVWYPDSAAKTAQALLDLRLEGLPLFILANWRGFSGGQRDLFEGVLQAGSLIVEHLRTYDQPVFVYIPRKGELRGGAWVVVDHRINPHMVEMYAEDSARGAVLEPEGVVEIKFRRRELIDAMHRLDPEILDLDKALRAAKKLQAQGNDNGSVTVTEGLIAQREKALLPVYTQIAVRFAELHDTPRRMAAKGAIRDIVTWENSRAYFYSRLCRKVAEDGLARQFMLQVDGLGKIDAIAEVKRWYLDEQRVKRGESEALRTSEAMDEDDWVDDKQFVAWVQGTRRNAEGFRRRVMSLRGGRLAAVLTRERDAGSIADGLAQAVSSVLQALQVSLAVYPTIKASATTALCLTIMVSELL
ncbi:unnamed protein product [Closterium sp. NIES-54]